MKLKVCGLSSAESIEEIAGLKPDMMGFIFYAPSPRNACAVLHSTVRSLPEGIERVGVFVDSPVDHVLHVAGRYELNIIQLHGKETPEMCREIRSHGYKVLKAVGVNADIDWDEYRAYEGAVDMLVLDTLTAMHGGSGRKFDWSLLKSYPLSVPFLLGGGVGPDDAPAVTEAAAQLPLMVGIDINSRFEIKPGQKDAAKVSAFFSQINA